MKIFQSTLKQFAILGIRSPQSNQKILISVKNYVILFIMILGMSVSNGSEVLYAQDFREYTQALYNISTMTVNIFDFLIHIWTAEKLFKFIKSFEKFIEKSMQHLN